MLFATVLVGDRTKAAAQLPGAIFTTDSNCVVVNENVHYDTKADVYLNGGPKGIGQAGLPEGDYYVRVTEPNGTLLGTSVGGPAGDKPVHVNANGEFASCYQLSAILKKASDGTPGYDDTTNPGGEYKVWVSTSSTFVNSASKTDNFKVRPSIPPPPPPPQGLIEVSKFYDANADGDFNAGDVLLENWKVNINNGTTAVDRFTPLSELFPAGNYTVSEYLPDPALFPGWKNTTPTSFSFVLSVPGSQSVMFGNLCLGAGGGHTLGFWSNKNGESTLKDGGSDASELALLRERFLRNANGSHFNPTSFNGSPSTTAFRPWLLSANAVNMAYMLSAQMAAMTLNVEAGFVDEDAIIYAPGTNSANALGYATVGAVLNEANALLGTGSGVPDNGPNLYIGSGHPLRPRAEALKNALDKANNNQTFVHPDPCDYGF